MNMIQTKAAQPQGAYKPTTVDATKAAAHFRIIAVGRLNTIVWRTGESEMITDSTLAKLQKVHTWATDF